MTADHVAAGRWGARDKRITDETARALANGHVIISHVTFSTNAARHWARIDAAEMLTYFVAGTFGIFCYVNNKMLLPGREKV